MKMWRSVAPTLAVVALSAWLAGAAQAAVDVDALWDYGNPAESENRFRAALADPARSSNVDDRLTLQTQIARTLGLRGRFDEAQRLLDTIAAQIASAGPEPRVRLLLERGRTLRSSGRPADAKPLFEQAFVQADAARLERLAADALHMVALAEPAIEARIAWNRKTIDYARTATDPRAQGWQAAALNNIGSDLRGAGRLEESLAVFREALVAYERGTRASNIRFARWQVANVLRLLGRGDEALLMQQQLEIDSAAAGAPDRYVFDELAALFAARGDEQRAAHYRELAQSLLPK
jgi:tetratricopeptide (TPR) repeat protein